MLPYTSSNQNGTPEGPHKDECPSASVSHRFHVSYALNSFLLFVLLLLMALAYSVVLQLSLHVGSLGVDVRPPGCGCFDLGRRRIRAL